MVSHSPVLSIAPRPMQMAQNVCSEAALNQDSKKAYFQVLDAHHLEDEWQPYGEESSPRGVRRWSLLPVIHVDALRKWNPDTEECS